MTKLEHGFKAALCSKRREVAANQQNTVFNQEKYPLPLSSGRR